MCTEQIEATLQSAADAWNSGDLEEFLSHYLPDSETSLLSGEQYIVGYAEIRRHYAANNFGVGMLQFELHKISLLSDECAYVEGYYRLNTSREMLAQGSFSLLMKHVQEKGRDGQWYVFKDHSA